MLNVYSIRQDCKHWTLKYLTLIKKACLLIRLLYLIYNLFCSLNRLQNIKVMLKHNVKLHKVVGIATQSDGRKIAKLMI